MHPLARRCLPAARPWQRLRPLERLPDLRVQFAARADIFQTVFPWVAFALPSPSDASRSVGCPALWLQHGSGGTPLLDGGLVACSGHGRGLERERRKQKDHGCGGRAGPFELTHVLSQPRLSLRLDQAPWRQRPIANPARRSARRRKPLRPRARPEQHSPFRAALARLWWRLVHGVLPFLRGGPRLTLSRFGGFRGVGEPPGWAGCDSCRARIGLSLFDVGRFGERRRRLSG
jgi:hypothetical protein